MRDLKRLAPELGLQRASAVLGVSRSTARRLLAPPPPAPPRATARSPHPRALTPEERATVLEHLHAPRFVDTAPAEVVATLLDEGTWLASTSTMYRILRQNSEVRERRRQARHPIYTRPELLARRPDEVWSWDITRIKGPDRGVFFYLYVMLDLFSRAVVGWMAARTENATLAQRFIDDTCDRRGVQPGSLTIHADRGSPMRAQSVAQLLDTLGVARSHSRPRVSNDNPYSESQFKTLKYRCNFPDRFGSLEDARAWCATFFTWYNDHHRHSGIAMLTPASVYHGHADRILERRRQVLLKAYAAHPERFVRKPPAPTALPEAVWINPPLLAEEGSLGRAP